jgi:N-acetylmuramoyl-L-alanine amidase
MMTAFAPDAAVVSAIKASPNHGARRAGCAPDMILMHYTGMSDTAAALDRLCDPAPGDGHPVSAHYLVFEDGRILQCVAEARRAWHAGVASWQGDVDVNSRSIGIEIANPGHDLGYRDFPDEQIAAVVALCADILRRRPIPPDRILGHADVAPARKRDPGEKFPWQTLFSAGIGHWVEPTALTAGAALEDGAHGRAVAALQSALAAYGYRVELTDRYDQATREAVAAFQRHFRPARVDGRADRSTVDTLGRLSAARHRLAASSAGGVWRDRVGS